MIYVRELKPGVKHSLDHRDGGVVIMGEGKRSDTLPSRLPLSRLSFRWQILLLGSIVFVLFVAVLFAAVATLRYTKFAVLTSEKKHLIQITQNLAREYEDKAEFSQQSNEPTPLSNPTAASSREVLILLARVVLQDIEGVSGGFYSKASDAIVAYPDPSNSAENRGDSSGDEQRAILDVSRNAVVSHQPSERVLSNGSGIVLIEALPIRDGYSVVGSAWTIRRLAGVPGSNRFRAYLTASGLGIAALASVLLTLLVISNLQRAVRKVEGGLEGLERNLESKIDPRNDPEEIQRIVQGINRLGATLKEKIEHEKKIENDLRHSERLASLGRLVAGVAHEVRNPLATIRLRVQMCRRDAQDPRVNESCSVALEEIERLNGMVNRLLSFARPLQLLREPTDLRNIVKERIECFRERAAKCGVGLVATLPQEDKICAVDKGRMAQVFDNIIQNAIEAMTDTGGTLSVNVASHPVAGNGNAVRIEFQDTGKGMSSEVMGRMFDPFFTTKVSGTGLGLSICHELVTAHGGNIQVNSEEGHGTNVMVTIPAGYV